MNPTAEALAILSREAAEHPNARIGSVVNKLRRDAVVEQLRETVRSQSPVDLDTWADQFVAAMKELHR